jgi:hypothetical protein
MTEARLDLLAVVNLYGGTRPFDTRDWTIFTRVAEARIPTTINGW